MEVLELNGVTYVKASSIARDLGYTADYVGQLCRAGKVDAQLVGRSWYVNETSIKDHKKSRYRSNAAKTADALKSSLVNRIEDSSSVVRKSPVSVVSVKTETNDRLNFYDRSSEQKYVYVEDRTELIPTLKKRESSEESVSVEVRHADAKKVDVKKTNKPYRLEPTELPKIRFKGAVSIIEPEDKNEESGEVVQSEQKTHSEHTTRPKIRTDHTSKSEVKQKGGRSKMRITEDSDDREKLHRLPLRHSGAVSMTRQKTAVSSKTSGELRVAAIKSSRVVTGRFTFLYITAALVLGLALSAAVAFTETSLVATDNSIQRTFSVNISAVLDSIDSFK